MDFIVSALLPCLYVIVPTLAIMWLVSAISKKKNSKNTSENMEETTVCDNALKNE